MIRNNRRKLSYRISACIALYLMVCRVMRAAVVERLERLAVVRKVAGSISARTKHWKTFTDHPAVNGYLVNFRDGLRRRQERIGPLLSQSVPKTRWDSNTPLPPTTIKGTFTITFLRGMNWMRDLIISASNHLTFTM